MSVFDKIDPDAILLQKYIFKQYPKGDSLIPININWSNYEDTYVDIDLAWWNWRVDRVSSINYRWKIDLHTLSKKAWLNAMKRELHFNRIKTLVFRGKTYYNNHDLFKFGQDYELMVVWRYCRYHKFHWDGHERVVLTNNEETESYEYIQ